MPFYGNNFYPSNLKFFKFLSGIVFVLLLSTQYSAFLLKDHLISQILEPLLKYKRVILCEITHSKNESLPIVFILSAHCFWNLTMSCSWARLEILRYEPQCIYLDCQKIYQKFIYQKLGMAPVTYFEKKINLDDPFNELIYWVFS